MPDAFRLSSAAFDTGGRIPAPFTCEGDDASPPLSWTGAPAGTRSFALIVDDPDAPRKTFVHWVLFNLPPDASVLPQGVDVAAQFADRSPVPAEGVNDMGEPGYSGPCPPKGHGPHHYSFRLYALDAALGLAAGATKHQLTQAMDGHVLAEADLTGIYER